MTFPATPYIGQKWLDGGRVWQWNGTAWQAANNSVFWEEIAGKPTYMAGSTIVSTSAPANPIPGLQWWNPTADRLFIWDGAAWVEPNTSTTYPWDADAVDYIYRVQAADGQELEKATQKAINAFVIGCKTDGIWSSIKASCIMAGAKTLEGAITPLVGAAPTNFGFISLDYDRKTGLKGDGSNKYLNSNRNNNADPQDSKHVSIYISEPDLTLNSRIYLGAGGSENGKTQLNHTTDGSILYNLNSQNAVNTTDYKPTNISGFTGATRSSSSSWYARGGSTNYPFTRISYPPVSHSIGIFSRDSGIQKSSGRLSFYSIGEHLDLALLDARLSTLMSELQASIP